MEARDAGIVGSRAAVSSAASGCAAGKLNNQADSSSPLPLAEISGYLPEKPGKTVLNEIPAE
jgi:hypothetical protein